MPRPKVAWFTPLQPVESGISLYSEDILPLLENSVEIDVIVDGYRPEVLRETETLKIRGVKGFRPEDYDLVIYQVGNSPAHIYMLEHIQRTPGLLVLHDVVLNHLFIQQAARNGTLHEYRSEMKRRYGSEGDRAAVRVMKGQAPDDLFRYPMSESLIDGNIATLVHSEFARSEVLDMNSGARVFHVPHGMRLPEDVSTKDARIALGIPADQFVIASITHVSPYKRLDVVLRALRQLRREIPARLVLAGSVSENYPLRRMISHLGLDQVVDVLGYVDDREARLIAAAADVIVNLRYPTAGETSGSLLHCMAAGRPVIVSKTGSFSEVPPDTVVRVPVDALEEPMLVSTLRLLATNDRLRRAIGYRARQFIASEHSLSRWAGGYLEAIGNLTGRELSFTPPSVPEEPALDGFETRTAFRRDPLLQEVALNVAELGLGGDDELLEEIARSAVELGLGLGKMKHGSNADP